MRIGVPTEIKANEYRVGLTPSSVAELRKHGHSVVVQAGAGAGIHASDEAYRNAGAKIESAVERVFESCELLVKVKEPQPIECLRLRQDQVLFTYLHLAANKPLALDLMRSGATAIAYETVSADDGSLPLLAPMSEVAGRLSVQAGAYALQREHGGAGILLGGVPGVPAARVVVIGGGVVGTNASQIALGMRANVTVLDRSIGRLRELDALFDGRIETIYATSEAVEYHVRTADLVIGAVLIPGAAAPKLVSAELVGSMRPGAVLVDVAIDQGGCFATSRATTHADPTFILDGVVHYCVANMPGAVPHTATYALNNATLPYVLDIADKGVIRALTENPHLGRGLNIYNGHITHKTVADALGIECSTIDFSRAA
ncbi:MAG: alanine dehydrogenase [Gammaproteobacteria bacterium]|jgi:alanine dehydrogenase